MGCGDLITGSTAIAKFVGGKSEWMKDMARTGQLPAFKIGRRWCMSRLVYERFCAERSQAALEGAGV